MPSPSWWSKRTEVDKWLTRGWCPTYSCPSASSSTAWVVIALVVPSSRRPSMGRPHRSSHNFHQPKLQNKTFRSTDPLSLLPWSGYANEGDFKASHQSPRPPFALKQDHSNESGQGIRTRNGRNLLKTICPGYGAVGGWSMSVQHCPPFGGVRTALWRSCAHTSPASRPTHPNRWIDRWRATKTKVLTSTFLVWFMFLLGVLSFPNTRSSRKEGHPLHLQLCGLACSVWGNHLHSAGYAMRLLKNSFSTCLYMVVLTHFSKKRSKWYFTASSVAKTLSPSINQVQWAKLWSKSAAALSSTSF